MIKILNSVLGDQEILACFIHYYLSPDVRDGKG